MKATSNSLAPLRRRKRERTADHLSATAFRLFEAHGFDAVTMEEIAAEAGVVKATLYSHFPVKEALLAHRFREDIAAGMSQRAAALAAHRSFESRMRYLLEESAQWHAARRCYLPAYIQYQTNQARLGELPRKTGPREEAPTGNDTRRILAAMFLSAQQNGEIDKSLNLAMLAVSMEYLLLGAVTGWLKDPSIDLTTRFQFAFDLVWQGIATTRGSQRSNSTSTVTTK